MSEIDPELGATWRAASREQPPAALDDAVRAAARREVGAKPGGFRAAPRWWPLAAAATVAAIAVGIVQMTPPEQVTPATIPAAIEPKQRDVKPDTDKPMANEPQREAPGAAAAPEAQRGAGKPAAKEQRRGAADEIDRGVVARGRSDSFAAAPNEQFQEKKTLASRQARPQRVEEAPERDQALKRKSELAAASSAARPSPAVSNPPTASGPRNELQPFPATPVPAEPGVSNVAPPMAAAAVATAPATAPTSVPAPAIAARKLAAQSSATGALSGNGAGNAEPAPAQDAAALGKVNADMADKVTLERRKDLSPLAPDEWIKRIRRLIAEGKNEDAAKALVAFRREYKDRSDSLLPSDLRAFRQ
jgi:hypothetical protein